MTYTQPQIDTDFNIVPGEDIAVRAKKMQAAAQKQVAEDIVTKLGSKSKFEYLEITRRNAIGCDRL